MPRTVLLQCSCLRLCFSLTYICWPLHESCTQHRSRFYSRLKNVHRRVSSVLQAYVCHPNTRAVFQWRWYLVLIYLGCTVILVFAVAMSTVFVGMFHVVIIDLTLVILEYFLYALRRAQKSHWRNHTCRFRGCGHTSSSDCSLCLAPTSFMRLILPTEGEATFPNGIGWCKWERLGMRFSLFR